MNLQNISLPDYHHARVLVIGDVILDQFWQGHSNRISPEAPVPIFNYQNTTIAPGGAGNVAMNLAALGVKTTLIGVVGDDDNAERLADTFHANAIDFLPCIADEGKPTITKIRMMSHHQQLLRVDNEQLPMRSSQLLTTVSDHIADFDYIIASDYAKGALADIPAIIALAKLHGKRVLIDPKGNDFSRYKGAYLLTPNLSEFYEIMGCAHGEADLTERAKQLIQQLNLGALLLTRSEAGMSIFERQDSDDSVISVHHSAKAQEVFDVTGAGDTVIALLTASLAAGSELNEAVEIANVGAGIVVGKVGTATVTPKELIHALKQLGSYSGYISEAQLLKELQMAKANGETIVMTNGCFDILHNGHVRYLSEAATLGDRLLVAINTDDSVRRLKGDERPVNALESRANVLAQLRAVDWVVAFDEDTPERLIAACQPDFLVKGGDNDPNRIPGADSVRQAGGEVRVMSYLNGVSTTKTIEKIKQRTQNNKK